MKIRDIERKICLCLNFKITETDYGGTKLHIAKLCMLPIKHENGDYIRVAEECFWMPVLLGERNQEEIAIIINQMNLSIDKRKEFLVAIYDIPCEKPYFKRTEINQAVPPIYFSFEYVIREEYNQELQSYEILDRKNTLERFRDYLFESGRFIEAVLEDGMWKLPDKIPSCNIYPTKVIYSKEL